MKAKPVADIYRVIDGEVRLLAGRRKHDSQLTFPIPEGGEADNYEQVLLPSTGTVWSWTVQRFAPKSPYDGPADEAYQPYGVAYVQFGELLIVEGRVVSNSPTQLKIGQPMRVIQNIYTKDSSGHPIETYAFAPLEP